MNTQFKLSCKKYIHRTWPGLREFFTQYVGVLPGIRERLSLPSPEIGLITNSAAGFGRLNDLIVELEKLLKGFRDARLQVVTQTPATKTPRREGFFFTGRAWRLFFKTSMNSMISL